MRSFRTFATSCLALVLAVLAGPVAAQSSPQVGGANAPADALSGSAPEFHRMLDQQDVCPVGLPLWATDSERFAWDQICRGKIADMSLFTSTSAQVAGQPAAADPTEAGAGPAATGAGDGAGCIAIPPPGTPDTVWPDHRRLSARFIKLITTREPYVFLPAVPSVYIKCAQIEGQLDLFHEHVPQRLVLRDSRIPQGLLLDGAVFASDLILNGSDMLGSDVLASGLVAANVHLSKGRAGLIDLSWARVTGSVVLDGAMIGKRLDPAAPSQRSGLWAPGLFLGGSLSAIGKADIQEVNVGTAQTGGDVTFDTSLVRGKVNLNGIRIGGALFMRRGARIAELDLIASRIERGVELSGLLVAPLDDAQPEAAPISASRAQETASEITGSIKAGRMVVGDSSFLDSMTVEGGLDLNEAVIKGPLYLDSTEVRGRFQASGIQVEGPISVLWGAAFRAFSLRGANVAGAVQLFGSTFDGPLDFRNASIGSLELADTGSDIIWGPLASLDLRNADIGVLQARFPESWRITGEVDGNGEPKDLPIQLENLRYERLAAGAPPEEETAPSELDADSLIRWVSESLPKLDEDQAVGFIPQPFRQLEQTLRSMGAEEEADQVQVAGHVHQINAYSADLAGWFKTVAGLVWWALVGFGAYPFRVLWWFAGLVGLGVIVARWNVPLRERGWTDCFWYSLENAFPLLQPSTEHQKVVHDHPVLQNFFHFQKVAGFVLATILVGALTLLGG